ncbi:MAG TPA: hypothetical protein VK788_24185 [Terriglobales bacterium]|nr:hypothetical protein [Terriglobales bacterium]
MFRTKLYAGVWLLLICSAVSLSAQQAALTAANTVVPPLVKFSGVLADVNNKPLTGTVGVTFSLYKESQSGAPLWMETQNVTLDKAGHYTVSLGSTTSQGLPASPFAAGEARWLAVQVQGQAEQPRVLLMSVPYALKALDAETIGGKPLSALQLAAPNGSSASVSSNSNNPPIANTITCSTSSACKSGHIPVFASNGGAAKVKDSIIQENGSTISIAGSESLTGPISASTTSSSSAAVVGYDNTSGGSAAVSGTSTNGIGVVATGITGLLGTGAGEDGVGVSASGNLGVYANGIAAGVYGVSTTSTGVIGISTSYIGVYGSGSTGVNGVSTSGGNGVSGVSTSGPGVYAQSDTGWAVDAYGTENATGVLAGSASGYAAWFNGNVDVDGNLSKAGGSFKIDHPLDPSNKYLYHSFVESPDMKNIYDGNVTTNGNGDAVVTLPKWFEALNRDFRYQLTVIGQFAQAIVGSEISHHQFSIKTDKPNVKVSWQVTGIRQDAWANAHRIPVEELKPGKERGSYLHPELYGAPEEKGVLWARDPKAMKQWKEARTKPAAIAATTNKTQQ